MQGHIVVCPFPLGRQRVERTLSALLMGCAEGRSPFDGGLGVPPNFSLSRKSGGFRGLIK